jgi:hypothetical protein
MVGKLEVIREVDKNGSSKSKIEKYEIPLSILLQYLGWC